jgi:Fe-S-cluster containining protein
MNCIQCGVCCKLFLINLTEEEYKSKKYKTQFDDFELVGDFEEAEMIGANIISQKEDGTCIYQRNNQCSIHKTRPQSCRNFFCTSKDPKFKTMIAKIKDYKKIL